ncbi:MAG: hypothetical protein ACRCTY_03615 [Candidatus Adiutrix sp.]
MTTNENHEFLKMSAKAIEQQAMDNPGIGIPVDPDVADFMGISSADEAEIDVQELLNEFGDELLKEVDEESLKGETE